MVLVVDASVALRWVLDEADSAQARRLEGRSMVAPSFWIVEAANALWRNVRGGQLVQDDAERRLQRLERSPLKSFEISPDVQTAFTISADLKHPVYDCFYLALAIRLDTTFITADGRFQRAAARRPDLGPRVTLLEEIAA